ncbi:hypothetical protein BH11BAC1_BH11BAC1_16870 [soil metagenome]
MNSQSLHSIQRIELFAGINARIIHTDNLTIAHMEIKGGSMLPEHSHVHDKRFN